jgi:hypothetical protein
MFMRSASCRVLRAVIFATRRAAFKASTTPELYHFLPDHDLPSGGEERRLLDLHQQGIGFGVGER